MPTDFKVVMMKTHKELILLLCSLLTIVVVRAQNDQSGFISIDCGIARGSNYSDRRTDIHYVSDADFIDSGENHTILSPDPQLTTLTSFPENNRNCYTLRPTKGKGYKYLIRARFMYGNYDFKEQLPEFDVYLGPDYWDTVKLNSSTAPVNMEIIHMSSSDYIHVCLLNTGRGTPFISALELRLLGSDMYNQTDLGSLYLFKYADFGNASGIIRFKPDMYDRLWSPTSLPNAGNFLLTPNKISSELSRNTRPPSRVMSTAITPTYPTNAFNITWNERNTSDKFLIYLHFAELEILKTTQKREFNIYLNGNLFAGPLSPVYQTATTVYSTKPEIVSPAYTLTINSTKNSTLPPIVNALELYTLKQLPQKQTYDQDASAMRSIKSTYRLTKNWQGDPCTPQEFVWDGLRCSSDDKDSLRITFLNLSTSGLNGEIASAIANLTMIHTLDLSSNNLTGTVPNFLSELNFLKVLNIKGNNFIGPVPEELLAKLKQGTLSLSIDDESAGDAASSCGRTTCKKKNKKIIVPVIVVVAFIFMTLTVFIAIWIFKKQKTHGMRNTGLRIRKQQYTYSEVQSITNNFNVVLGKGGFGAVYHGHIGDTQVAVKMLSETSNQGEKEFQAEAVLLMSVHHKNLTSFVGYCNEEKHKGIIYEYMANGNLERHLRDTYSGMILDWEKRLQIGCDAAHGLEYLHHGCKPPIIHRDIKTTNILLNERFQAKLADFGLSRAFPTDGATHISTAVAGTRGYFDPKYHISRGSTEKNDIYSFGVVLLEIITGQRAVIKYEDEFIHISHWVSLKLLDGNLKNIVDPRIPGDFDINSAWKAIEVAMACVTDTPSRRPTMNKVVMELNDCLVMERARKETELSDSTCLVSLNLESVYDPHPR